MQPLHSSSVNDLTLISAFTCVQDAFVDLVGKAKDLFANPSKALSAAIYTEVSDCEDELNGLFTYDRRVRMHAHALMKCVLSCSQWM